MSRLVNIELTVTFILPESIVGNSSLFQAVANPVGIVVDHNAVIDYARTPTDCRTKLGQTITGQVAEVGVPDGHARI